MRRYNRHTKNIQTKATDKKGFSFDNALNKVLSVFSSKKSYDKKVSNKIYDIVSNKEETEYRGRSRNGKSNPSRTERHKKGGKFGSWLKKSLFVAGRIRFSRMAAGITLIVVIVLTSGSIVLASNTEIFRKPMPYENENLIPAVKTLYIKDGDDVIVHVTPGGTIKDMLEENEIALEDDDKISPPLYTTVENRMRVEIKRAVNVSVKTSDDSQSFVMYGGTVAEALKEAGVEYDDDDIIEPSLDTEITEDVAITFDSVKVEKITEEVVVEYETEYVDEPTILKGYWDVKQKGKDGSAEVTYEVTYVNGVEQTRKAIEENMLKEPVTKIVRNGVGLTRIDDEVEDNNDTGGEETGGESNAGTPSSVPNPNEQATNPSVPPAPGTYVKSIVAHVTAYTHTGHHTATGPWPRSTRTRENPGSCAVVPDTFPYGSLLYVPGYGYCIAEDTGGFRHNPDRWNQIDVFMNTPAECSTWGRRREWTIYVIRYGY